MQLEAVASRPSVRLLRERFLQRSAATIANGAARALGFSLPPPTSTVFCLEIGILGYDSKQANHKMQVPVAGHDELAIIKAKAL